MQTSDWERPSAVPVTNPTAAVRVSEGPGGKCLDPARPGRAKGDLWWHRFPRSGIKSRPQVRPSIGRRVAERV